MIIVLRNTHYIKDISHYNLHPHLTSQPTSTFHIWVCLVLSYYLQTEPAFTILLYFLLEYTNIYLHCMVVSRIIVLPKIFLLSWNSVKTKSCKLRAFVTKCIKLLKKEAVSIFTTWMKSTVNSLDLINKIHCLSVWRPGICDVNILYLTHGFKIHRIIQPPFNL